VKKIKIGEYSAKTTVLCTLSAWPSHVLKDGERERDNHLRAMFINIGDGSSGNVILCNFVNYLLFSIKTSFAMKLFTKRIL